MTELEAFRNAAITYSEDDSERNVPLRAPYAFVPAGDKVLSAPVTPRHDRPLAGAVQGRLRIKLTAETPILVGGSGNGENANNEPGQTPDGRWMIPGTSLRGMVRSVLESAAFARMSFVDDCAAASRDFRDPTWLRNVCPSRGMRLNGGWLFITADGWKLVPAERTERVHFDEVLGWVGASETVWHGEDMHTRLTRLESRGIHGNVDAANFARTGTARLVVAGPTADTDRTGDTRKQHEYLFFWPSARNAQPVNDRCGELFLGALAKDANSHTDKPETNYSALTAAGRAAGFADNWGRWTGNRRDTIPTLDEQIGNPNCWALPVFWRNRGRGDNGDAQRTPQPDPILSLTAFLKVPYQKGLKDIVSAGARPEAGRADDYDLVQALFGWAAPDVDPDKELAGRTPQERALRSRVRFGFAFSDTRSDDTELLNRTWAATRPRASFWPYYLRAGDGQARHPVDFDNDKAIVAGRKRYPARDGARNSLPHFTEQDGLTREQVTARNSNLSFLPAGTSFEGEIRLHNVTPVELGGLIWALTFGQIDADGAFTDAGFRHMLGRARTWGYGQIRLELLDRGADLKDVITGKKADLAAAVAAFKDWVCQGVGADSFEDIETVRRLLNTAHAPSGAALNDRLRFPAVNGNDTTGDSIVKGYTEIRKKAQELGRANSVAPMQADTAGYVGLPAYPRVENE